MTTVRTARPDDQAGSGGELQPGAEPEPGVPRAPAGAHGRAAGRFAHSLVWEQARARPRQVALRADGERDRTYADLRVASARLAARLVEAGVGPDDTVAVLMERSADVVVAMLAILDAGGAYATVDLAQPPARVAGVLRDLRPRAVVADRGRPVPDAAGGVPVLHVAEAGGAVAGDDGADPPGPRRSRRAPLREDNLAYVLHTSGSTGVPKGVAMTHRGLNRLLAWQLEDGEQGLTTLQFTSFCFDVTFQEVFSTLAGGGTLYLPSGSRRQDPDQLLLAMREHRVARLFLPNVALRQVVTAAGRSGVVPDTLRHVVTAGERLTITSAVARFFDALGGARLDNHYGPTETHLVTSHRLTGPAADWPAFPPIGTPVGEVTVHLLDDELAPVRAGEVGQLYVGGAGLARGYLRAPGATADRFRPDPFAAAPGARLYRTGDLARADETGLLHFLGRDDGQLKVRGFRVEPAEVELVLAEHPGVRDAAVGLRAVAGDTGGTVRVLVAFVVPEGTAESSQDELSVAELLSHVRDRLPDYLVPSRFVFVDHLPVTSTGKLDRSGLASLPLAVVAPPSAEDGPARAEPTAAAVRAVWERVLGHGEFADDEDFFDVGGDSLLAVWAVRELADRFGRDLDLSIFLRDSTVAAVTAALGAAAPSAAAVGAATDAAVGAAAGAAAVRGGGRRGWSEAVTLRSGPSTRVLFLAPPLGGELLTYRELAAALRSPVRVVGLRWRAPGHLDHSLAELARVHLEQVRAVQPDGPYLLAGWSFGGVVAYELAQQLLRAGERVDFLGLLDANPVRDPLTGMTTAQSPHLAVLDQALASMTGPGGTGDPGGVGDPARAAAPVDSASWRGLLGGGLPDGMTVSHLRDTLAAARASTRAAMSYHARPYPGAVHLFQAAASPEVIRDALRADFDALVTGTARVVTVPGDHRGMLRAPDVAVLAEAIDTTLRGA